MFMHICMQQSEICNAQFQLGHFGLLSGRRDRELNISDNPNISGRMATLSMIHTGDTHKIK